MYGLAEVFFEQINTSTGTVLYLHHDQAGSPDGTRVGIREASKTGGSMVDINQDGTQYKIHLAE
ncbi:MAG TPA: hypothetical protein VN892_17305 [Solirubrobacteraceae bacterium]|nr:hypothetical protein [Solirubrobacteraceae bacterium]